jgi:hypothetical protein
MNCSKFTNHVLDILNNNGKSFNDLKKLYYITINTLKIELTVKYEKDLRGFEFVTICYIFSQTQIENPNSDMLKFQIDKKSRSWKLLFDRSAEYLQNLIEELLSLDIHDEKVLCCEKLY